LDIDVNAPRLSLSEFRDYWLEPGEHGRSLFSENEEILGEMEAQYRSECAMFGDAGPGQAINIAQCHAEISRVRRILSFR